MHLVTELFRKDILSPMCVMQIYTGITGGRVLDGELLYTKIFMKQSVGKCKQINFWNLCVSYVYKAPS